jgi:predicted Ser/Thr protein kinase
MLTDAEILVLKLAFERRLLDEATLARCVAIYKASGGSRQLGAILTTEGKIKTDAALKIGELSKTSAQAKGSIIVSRRDMEDELLIKLIESTKVLDDATIKRAQLEQKGYEKQGRFISLGDILTNRNLISQINFRKLIKRVHDRLATCAGCYRHFVTPKPVEPGTYPCRHCGKTIFAGELPDQAFSLINGSVDGSWKGPRPAANTDPQGSGLLPGPRDSTAVRRPAPAPAIPGAHSKDLSDLNDSSDSKDPNRIFMTGRFDAIPVVAPPPPPSANSNTADEEMTVALSSLSSSTEAKAAPTGARFGDFEVIAELARGGYGVVYKARYNETLVALKILLGGNEANEQAVKRFEREAQICKKLKHHGVVGAISSGEIQNFPYLALEFIEGDTLEQRIQSGAMDPKVAAKILKDVAEAVHYAHTKGIVHRDLKPANVIISDETQQPKVIDFGVAKSLKDEMKFTQSNTTIGTPFYMSPEQVKGQHDSVGPRTDVYALGVILYEMIVGEVPFSGENPMELYHNIASEDVELPTLRQSRIPQDLETICLVAMSKEIAARYESAQALADDLGRFLSNRPIEARRPGLAIWTNPYVLIGAAIGFAVLLVVAVKLLKG